jgi:4-alpha-glucanotransferase
LDTEKKRIAKSPVKPAVKKAAPKKVEANATAKKSVKTKIVLEKSNGHKLQTIQFQLRYHTVYGQTIFVTGNHPLLGNGDLQKAIPLQYQNDDLWSVTIDFSGHELTQDLQYQYMIQNADGSNSLDAGNDKRIVKAQWNCAQLISIDSWNFGGYFENAFYTEPFANVLLKANWTAIKAIVPKKTTHVFKVKTPLLPKGQTVCLLGSSKGLQKWDTSNPILLSRSESDAYYSVSLDLSQELFPMAYKYGIYDTVSKQFLQYEQGNNRVLYEINLPNQQTLIHDGFVVLPNLNWKGAGVAIPVFSLRTEKSLGVGEFTDLKVLVDWAKKIGLKMLQILPVNDTTATHTWTDSYPYAAISAFALHPMFLNLDLLADKKTQASLDSIKKEHAGLNDLDSVDYETVNQIKLEFLREVFVSKKSSFQSSADFASYFETNKHWLEPYAVFCYLRDNYGTADFNQWPAYQQYKEDEIAALIQEGSDAYDGISLHYFIQYHLHLQLKDATEYAHQNGIIVKGDIPIGIYRYGADAWQHPELYHMDMQAGAPPDGFAIKGQNWGFPTYNWHKMLEDGFAWWKQRFEQMHYYFDAFRIDHILGFFRIWSIPMNAVEGIMGYFVPAIPIHINEINSKHVWFDYYRYTRPYITENIIWEFFGYDNETVKQSFLEIDGFGGYQLKPAFDTQRKVEKHFKQLPNDAYHQKLKQGLFDLISNVLLFEVHGSQGQQFHFRFDMENTSSFKNLDSHTQQQLKTLYIDYFYNRQDEFWKQEAMQKLPALKRVTNMLVCGEDLGMVPSCVPDVMNQLGLLSLEIQRMPKDSKKQFFHPNDAPYLSVVTPSTHDMSTIRGWWEEDRAAIQEFYNKELGQWGEAPFFCEAWINKAIVMQHLYSPAMWSVFQLQDILGMDETLRRENPNDERINIPANPQHYWRYRMQMTLEQLMEATNFNDSFAQSIKASGR